MVLRDERALKFLYRVTGCSEDDKETLEYESYVSQESIEQEKEVYRRLEQCDRIVSCLDMSGPGIQMTLMGNGNLHEYLQKHRPARSVQLSWFCQMARTLIQIHTRRVLVGDIAPRNFLLSTDLSIAFSDFNESTILSLDTEMRTADDHGYSIYTDIDQLGAVIYTRS